MSKPDREESKLSPVIINYFVVLLSTDKTRWLDSLSRQDVEREDEKIYQTWGKFDHSC